MKRAVIYCRVSTKEQVDNYSLGDQERICRDFCAREGYEVDRVFHERGESAKTERRTELRAMVKHLASGRRKVQAVVVLDCKRFSREVAAHYRIKAELAAHGAVVHFATEAGIDDTKTGRLMETIFAGMAEFDNADRTDKTVTGMKSAIAAGRWPWKAPLGYLNAGKAMLVPDPDRAPLIRMAFDLIASRGATSREARDTVKLTKQAFARLIHNPIYCGRIVAPKWGIEAAAAFAGIVSEETYDRAQAVLSGRLKASKTPTRHTDRPEFPLRRFVRCACGRPFTGSWSRGRSGQKYPNYRCPVAHVNATKGKLEGDFLDLLDNLRPKPEFLKLFTEIVLDVWRNRKEAAADELKESKRREAAIIQKQDKLDQAFLFDQSIDRDSYIRQRDALRLDLLVGKVIVADDELEDAEVEAVLAFAQRAIGTASMFWLEGDLAFRLRLQNTFFPVGLTYTENGFMEPRTSFAFSYLRQLGRIGVGMASPTGLEPVSPP
jgi:site-specific DNA recombinase